MTYPIAHRKGMCHKVRRKTEHTIKRTERKMAMRLIPTYFDDNGNTVTFVKLGAGYPPPFTHRVIINRVAVGMLSQDYKPSAKVAEFFLKEHGHKAVAA